MMELLHMDMGVRGTWMKMAWINLLDVRFFKLGVDNFSKIVLEIRDFWNLFSLENCNLVHLKKLIFHCNP